MTIIVYEALQANASGTNLATGVASANVAIPNNSGGTKARFVRLYATADCYVRQGGTGIAAAVGDMYIGAGPSGSVILNCNGATFIAAIQVSAAGLLNITPLDD